MTPEWLSFQNEFIPSPYISLYPFTWYRDEILFPRKSFQNEFISVFNPNEILVLVWHFILVSCNWKRTPFRDETANRVVWGEWGMRIVFKMVDKTVVFKVFQDGWVGQFCYVNAVWSSFWYHVNSPLLVSGWNCRLELPFRSQSFLWIFFVFYEDLCDIDFSVMNGNIFFLNIALRCFFGY